MDGSDPSTHKFRTTLTGIRVELVSHSQTLGLCTSLLEYLCLFWAWPFITAAVSRRGHDLTGGMCVNSGTVKEREKDRLTLLNL